MSAKLERGSFNPEARRNPDIDQLYNQVRACFTLDETHRERMDYLSIPKGQSWNPITIYSRFCRGLALHEDIKPKEQTSKSPEKIWQCSDLIKGFIHPDTEIKTYPSRYGYFFDDNSVYGAFLDQAREIQNSLGLKPRDFEETIPFAIFDTARNYFEKSTTDGVSEQKVQEIFPDFLDFSGEPFSVKRLKGQGIASCAEYAVLAENTLALVGIDVYLLIGWRCKLTRGDERSRHWYNVINSPNGKFLYDAVNPSLVVDKKGQAESYYPAVYPLSEEQFANLTKPGVNLGTEVEVAHKIYRQDGDELQTLRNYSRAYDVLRLGR